MLAGSAVLAGPGAGSAVAQSSGWVKRPQAPVHDEAVPQEGSSFQRGPPWNSRPAPVSPKPDVAPPAAAYPDGSMPQSAVPRQLDLQAATEALDRIEAGQESAADGRLSTEPITDVRVRLRHALLEWPRVIGLPVPSEAERSYVEVQISAVAGGRLSPPGSAKCNAFDGDVLMCALDCQGGTFGLRRGRHPGEHFMIVGISGTGTDRTAPGLARPGFRLGACTVGSPRSLLLMPRAGRLGAEIRLIEQR